IEILTRSRYATELIMKIQTIRIQRTRPCKPAVISDPPEAPGAVFEVYSASLGSPKAYTESPDLATVHATAKRWPRKFVASNEEVLTSATARLLTATKTRFRKASTALYYTREFVV